MPSLSGQLARSGYLTGKPAIPRRFRIQIAIAERFDWPPEKGPPDA